VLSPAAQQATAVAVPKTAGVAGVTPIGARYSAGLDGRLRRGSLDLRVKEGLRVEVEVLGRVGGRYVGQTGMLDRRRERCCEEAAQAN